MAALRSFINKNVIRKRDPYLESLNIPVILGEIDEAIKKIASGEIRTERALAYQQGDIGSRVSMGWDVRYGSFTDEQVACVNNHLFKLFPQDPDYVEKVLVTETLKYVISFCKRISMDEAEQMLQNNFEKFDLSKFNMDENRYKSIQSPKRGKIRSLRSGNNEDNQQEVAKSYIEAYKDPPDFKLVNISPEIGCGVFTKKEIKKGDFVLFYPGEMITITEGMQREKDYAKHLGSFLFFHEKTCFDATYSNLLGRYVNHSSQNANCKPVKICSKSGYRICLFAIKDILANIELRYNYGIPGREWKDTDKPVNLTYIQDIEEGGAEDGKEKRKITKPSEILKDLEKDNEKNVDFSLVDKCENKEQNNECFVCFKPAKRSCLHWECAEFDKPLCETCDEDHVCKKQYKENSEDKEVIDEEFKEHECLSDSSEGFIPPTPTKRKRKSLSVEQSKRAAVKKAIRIMQNKSPNNVTDDNDDDDDIIDGDCDADNIEIHTTMNTKKLQNDEKLRKAERAAEIEYEDHKETSKEKKGETDNIRKEYKKRLSSIKSNIKAYRKKEKMKGETFNKLFGKNAVVEVRDGGRRAFQYKCPHCGGFIQEQLKRHLINKHSYEEKDAKLLQTKMRVIFLWDRLETKNGATLPLPCDACGEWQMRLDHHLLHKKVHKNLTSVQRSTIISDAKKVWQNVMSSVPCDVVEEVVEETDAFVTRSKPSTFNLENISVSFVPDGAFKLASRENEEWKVKEEDYFTIFFKDANMLLDYFQKDLEETGTEKNVSKQHRNQVALIWGIISETLEMFPVHPLSNYHLLRNFYHKPSLGDIGKGGVQSSTLRSRYTSLGKFVTFLRKNQIFAGMSKVQLNLLESAIKDFNDDLKKSVHQRKIEVRQEKIRTLLTPKDFIKYGRSKHVQSLIKLYHSFKIDSLISFSLVTDFRDYLMSTLCIGNGLRPSNLMNLRIIDVTSASDAEGYVGHKVLTNSTYKTSTIYGEKFIVIADEVFAQLMFYIEKLRPDIPSNRVFTTKVDSINQTHVANSLTASFWKAGVIKNKSDRVTCTRIRCGIATYACNEGEYDSSFFAKHFMKNRESTTLGHYNLLSN